MRVRLTGEVQRDCTRAGLGWRWYAPDIIERLRLLFRYGTSEKRTVNALNSRQMQARGNYPKVV